MITLQPAFEGREVVTRSAVKNIEDHVKAVG